MSAVLAWVAIGSEGFTGLALILIGLLGFRLHRRSRPRPIPAPPPEPVDAIAEMLEAKASIRTDEVRRWAEAWQRAAGLPDFWVTVQEIREVEYRAVREDRERRAAAESAARLLAIEQRRTEEIARIEAERRDRAARAEDERRKADEERAAIARHQAHLAERRRRYAEARRTR